MRKRSTVVVRMFVVLVMSLGFATVMSFGFASSATAQTLGQCQRIIDGVIDQDPCLVEETDDGLCMVTIGEDIFQNIQCVTDACPQQFIIGLDIVQFQCGDDPTAAPPTATTAPPTATTAPPTATTAPPTATTAPPTATTAPGPTATVAPPTATVPDDDDDDDDNGTNGVDEVDEPGQAAEPAEEEVAVSVLPSTGQGENSGQNSGSMLLLLGAMGTVLLALSAAAMRMRRNG